MSRSLLAERLRTLEECGVVRRTTAGSATEYHLTQAGEELRPIVMALGHWGARWIGSRLKRDQLDAGFLMWDIRRFMKVDECPPDRCIVIHFRLTDAPAGERLWWLVASGGEVNLCREDPGREVTLIVESTVRALTEVWTGDRQAGDATRARRSRRRRTSRPPGSVAMAWPQRLRRDPRTAAQATSPNTCSQVDGLDRSATARPGAAVTDADGSRPTVARSPAIGIRNESPAPTKIGTHSRCAPQIRSASRRSNGGGDHHRNGVVSRHRGNVARGSNGDDRREVGTSRLPNVVPVLT